MEQHPGAAAGESGEPGTQGGTHAVGPVVGDDDRRVGRHQGPDLVGRRADDHRQARAPAVAERAHRAGQPVVDERLGTSHAPAGAGGEQEAVDRRDRVGSGRRSDQLSPSCT
ncbi:hypothetical protein QE405_002059 [Nocardioides zeae]|uniref:Uncharacterized protein n=1 Tax=Nocardioides zeae TaxID=1457234 RepID=A0AAJ1U2J2_9ACTN|nr:hypothetical protein [Nocardioides zeae]